MDPSNQVLLLCLTMGPPYPLAHPSPYVLQAPWSVSWLQLFCLLALKPPSSTFSTPRTWVDELLNLDAVAQHRRRVILRVREDDTGAVEQLDVLVQVHFLQGLGHAGRVADLRSGGCKASVS
jgi:hypothetical protein